ncbi:MAG: dihydroorotate dehydrogenase [Endomicrobium sp.]|jgi:dihydroorotate dehydrogenase (NAD+) catalytic subunit|nr:dihydroorotate dehydrogenase [Endomicrobium sp.]
MKPDLSMDFAGVHFKNPVLTASGTFGYGDELLDVFPVNKLGGIITKTVTLNPCNGNEQPRIAEVTAGLLNSIGLQNIGIENFISQPMKKLKKIGIPIIVSISGSTVEEYIKIIEILNVQVGVSMIELNLSCPNLNKIPICNDIVLMKNIIINAKKNSNLPIIVKLSPMVTDISEIAVIVQNAGADGITIANTYPAMAINIRTFKPKLSTVKGGMSGPCIKPLSIRCVYDVYKVINIPILGCGGIMEGPDVVEFILAGAKVVSIGSACLISPFNLINIVKELENILKKQNIKSLNSIVGKAHTIQ